MKFLWLDDVRDPEKFIEKMTPYKICDLEITWCKSYEEFKEAILKNLPDIISYDHDLGDGEEGCTGYDCAKFLVNYCMDNSLKAPEYFVHSSNVAGGDNIRNLLQNFKRYSEKYIQ